ncbi:MAG: 1-(5-phosphoribosyl)-5-[(5-phosphoribosylamino)methylideneamino]imidazole-4-carboxamide isomerase [Firmicutes bacterium]|nr:1-(5-phosphoribosyl)-5-[(5-phosphoribosylamino)methylideneamino]imidazole-4-carboxamide isomerase [Bacillota bacterium]
MRVIPAIDLRGGQCVRLLQGDFARETVFSADPVEVALRWQSLGARWLHVVDLDGARAGRSVQLKLLGDICSAVRIPVQAGGGFRDLESLEKAFEAGVSRVVLGTAACASPEFVGQACLRHGDRVYLAVDVRDGKVSTWGWLEDTAIGAKELVLRAGDIGARGVVYTDINSDGTLKGPNFEGIRELLDLGLGIGLIASGGISKLEHVEELRALEPRGLSGVIIGKALYTGDIDLVEALRLGGGNGATA